MLILAAWYFTFYVSFLYARDPREWTVVLPTQATCERVRQALISQPIGAVDNGWPITSDRCLERREAPRRDSMTTAQEPSA